MPALLLRRLVLGLVLLSAVVAVWTLLVLLAVRGDLVAARAALEEGRSSGEVEVATTALTQAEEQLDRSVSRLGQPGPALAAAVPLLGRPVRAVDRTAEAALAVVTATRGVLGAARTDDVLLPDGGIDLQALGQVQRALDDAARRTAEPVAALREQPLGLVPSFVAEPVRSAQGELGELPDTFERAAAGVRGLSALLGEDRPRRLLILLENNAELRGAGGLVTVFAEATAQDGRLQIEAFRDVEEVADPSETAEPVGAPEDYRALWGEFLANTTLWKNANMSPDLPTSSLVLSRIAGVTLQAPPDALLWFDVRAIQAVLEATGPAELADGRTLTADNAVEMLLSTAYQEVEDTREAQGRRRAALRAAADAVLGRVLGDGATPSLTALADELAEAARGRHVALWSEDPAEQADLEAAGLGGEVAAAGGDLSSFAVQNLGGGDTEGNKLDYYARRRVGVRVEVGPDEALVVQEVTLRNTAPPTGLPVYVAGGGTPGTTNNLISLALPAGAALEHLTRGGQALVVEPRPEGDHAVVTDVVSLAPGTEVTWELRYRLPLDDGAYRLQLIPQPLAFDADLDVQIRSAGGGHALSTSTVSELAEAGDGGLTLVEPFSARRDLQVAVERKGLPARALDAVRRFWNEPVRLP